MKQQNNSKLQFVSIGISLLALILSGCVFFNSTLKKPTIHISTGNKISFSITD